MKQQHSRRVQLMSHPPFYRQRRQMGLRSVLLPICFIPARTFIFPLKMRRQHITLDLQIHLAFTVSFTKLQGRRHLSEAVLAGSTKAFLIDSKQVGYLIGLKRLQYANIILYSPLTTDCSYLIFLLYSMNTLVSPPHLVHLSHYRLRKSWTTLTLRPRTSMFAAGPACKQRMTSLLPARVLG